VGNGLVTARPITLETTKQFILTHRTSVKLIFFNLETDGELSLNVLTLELDSRTLVGFLKTRNVNNVLSLVQK
jgi:hypothetical protein